ncbi:MAG: gamma-glutamylcyclotransferase [Salaquimonas sp.]|jgi:hypothetical protein|nr:gamma-glutamylcyclotransferase [Salaquimonas sp.]
MSEGLVGYFGYGSLVNRQTLATDYMASVPASLQGWRRHWQAREDGVEPADIALLTVHEHAESSILGMLVIDRVEHLASVDEREARYDRVRIARDALDFIGPEEKVHEQLPDELYVYVGRRRAREESPPMLLQSYLDAVMAGFLAEFGEEGLLHFFETTIGFDRAIVADRHQPIYKRTVTVDPHTASRFDDLLKQAGVRFASP